MPCQPLDLGYLAPPAEVLGESARVVGSAGHMGQRARPGQDHVDPGGCGSHLPGIKDRTQARNAVPSEERDNLVLASTGSMAAL